MPRYQFNDAFTVFSFESRSTTAHMVSVHFYRIFVFKWTIERTAYIVYVVWNLQFSCFFCDRSVCNKFDKIYNRLCCPFVRWMWISTFTSSTSNWFEKKTKKKNEWMNKWPEHILLIWLVCLCASDKCTFYYFFEAKKKWIREFLIATTARHCAEAVFRAWIAIE